MYLAWETRQKKRPASQTAPTTTLLCIRRPLVGEQFDITHRQLFTITIIIRIIISCWGSNTDCRLHLQPVPSFFVRLRQDAPNELLGKTSSTRSTRVTTTTTSPSDARSCDCWRSSFLSSCCTTKTSNTLCWQTVVVVGCSCMRSDSNTTANAPPVIRVRSSPLFLRPWFRAVVITGW